MSQGTEARRAELIEGILDRARWRLGETSLPGIEAFLKHYFARVPLADVEGETPDALFGLAYSHFRLAAQRAAGQAKLRCYDPNVDEDGWRSEHSVLQVITDDTPFLVDSVAADLGARDLAIHRIIHPIFDAVRDDGGQWQSLAGADEEPGGMPESFMHFEFTRRTSAELAGIAASVSTVLEQVRAAVDDWRAMTARMLEIGEAMAPPPHASPADFEEIRAFLAWLGDGHFTFLGYREYFVDEAEGVALARAVPGSGLGLLRAPEASVFEDLIEGARLPPAAAAFVARNETLLVTKTTKRSPVHRPVFMDAIVIRRWDRADGIVGTYLFVGLFTAPAYTSSARRIPLLRRKFENALASSGFDPRGHDGRALVNIIETFPRDELFQIADDQLLEIALGILSLQQRPRTALFLRRDDLDRFIVALVYVPRDRYSTDLRLRIQKLIERAFAGTVTAHNSLVGEGALARLHLFVTTLPGQIPPYDEKALEQGIVAATRSWADHLSDALISTHGEAEGRRLLRRYGDAFPPGYQDHFDAVQAVADIDTIEATLARGSLGLTLYRAFGASETEIRFKVFHPGQPIPLSQILPVLEHLGLTVIDEVPHEVVLRDHAAGMVMIHDFGLLAHSGRPVDLAAVRAPFQEAFLAVWSEGAESDALNALVLAAGLTWRRIVILRAYVRYLRQVGIGFTQTYIQQTLVGNAEITRLIVELFVTLFDPGRDSDREARAAKLRADIDARLEDVVSADQDRILRRVLNLVESTLRTNAFRTGSNGARREFLSLKLDSRRLEELPLPRPFVEVFVYSPRVEAVHLRGGKVARGGIRWSDRREDFRTEILGLIKAQMVKNAVIVPVGAKGGFYVKRPPASGDREAVLKEGIACYRTFMRGLLDITDNLDGDKVVPPPSVVRRDGDDPYLVVAADKGTATFSDIANGIAADYGFWLGDAFASGGSQGYDHKQMGITARGAWVSVERHFREAGIDIGAPFTVIGVGDMSGDVFGNGMLLSPQIKLLAAFDHRHIFLDPDPDPEASFAERQHLFTLPRSSWADYDKAVLSAAAGIFPRAAKSITVSDEARERFGLSSNRLTPNELIRALLVLPVDLLWFGGIGTFVKSSEEANAAAGDRVNDAVRVDARDLGARVVGEGANLGITQLGRIEFARHGGRINTDFIDNSAGVDCSDHEVNIKILLDAIVAEGDLTEKHRNGLLAEMTDEVGTLVLRDNYLQTQAISLIAADGVTALDSQTRLIRMLERQGRLDRAVEFLPDEEALAERVKAGTGLTRPELAVLFSYCKIWLYDEILASGLPDDRYLAEDIVRYFPKQIHERYPARVGQHRLCRELVATLITNSLINRVGVTFVSEIAEKSGAATADIARAYLIARDVYALRPIWSGIEELDGRVQASVQVTLHRDVQTLVSRATLWFLLHGGDLLDIAGTVSSFGTAVAGLSSNIAAVLPEDADGRILHRAGRYESEGVPEALARRVAYLVVMPSACDIVRLAAAQGVPAADVARLYFAIGETFSFGWLRYQAEKQQGEQYWQRLAVSALIEELYAYQRDVTARVLASGVIEPREAIAGWSTAQGAKVERTLSLLAEVKAAGAADIAMLTVAGRQLRTLTEA